jgi:pimeloyl-ACP methyl ester carboxylesterase
MRSTIRIAGPLAIIALLFLGYALYTHPLGSLFWTYQTRLSWSGIVRNAADIKPGKISWLEAGFRGEEAVVLIHGLGVEGALEWRDNMKPLAEGHFRVIAPDLIGFGDSAHPSTPSTIDFEARAIWELLDGLKINQANLIGRDIGADVVLQMAIDFPERAQRMVLVSGGLFGKAGLERERAAFILKDDSQAPQFASLTLIDLPTMPSFIYSRMMPELSSTQEATRQLLDDAPGAEGKIHGDLGKIFNTLKGIIWGKKDTIQPISEADRLHDQLVGSAIGSIDNTGHTPNEERPDEFNDIAYTFLKQ